MSQRSSVLAAVERLERRILLAADFGDAPDLGSGTGAGDYETLAANGGPSHTIDATQTTLFLGASVDGDDGTLQNARANADDVDGALPDDEDGIVDPADLRITAGTTPTVRVRATNISGGDAVLSGWIDFNGDGTFDNATERSQAVVFNGRTDFVAELQFASVPEGFTGTTFARLRLSRDPDGFNSPTGAASDGEVEDHVVTITRPGAPFVRSQTRIADGSGGFPADALEAGDRFGSSVTSLGDVDGDGVIDVAVGARTEGESGVDEGALYVLMLNSDGTVKSRTKISNGEGGLAADTLDDGDYFGTSVTSLGDLDGDGVTDIAVGARTDENLGTTEGAVYVLFLNSDGTVKAQQ